MDICGVFGMKIELLGYKMVVIHGLTSSRLKLKLECGPTPDVMVSLLNPCAQRRKVWLAPTARVPCSNAVNIGECKTSKTQSDLAPGKIPLRGNNRRKCINSLPAQETAKHRAKFGWFPLSDVEAKTRNPLKFVGCPKPASRSQPLVGRSSPYCGDMWRRYCCLRSFFRLSMRALVAKMQPDKVVRWCPDGDVLRHFSVPYFQRAACSTFQTCILNSHEGHTMCGNMVDIQSPTAEIRRGKRKIDR